MEPVILPPVRRLLFIKPSSLGDIVHALPAFDAIRRRFPEAELSWLVKEQWAGILERVEGLDRIWPVGQAISAWLTEIGRLRAYGFDVVVDLQGLFRSGATAWLTGCAIRIGFSNAREGSPLCYTHRVPVSSAEMHAVDRYLLVARALGCPSMTPTFRLSPLEEDRKIVHALLSGKGVPPGASWVAMHVSARWATKRWPLGSYVQVARALVADGTPVMLIGAASEQSEARQVAELTGAHDLSGQTSLAVLPALLQEAACLVTNDSGPMHVAAAVNTPVVALFGPTSPARTGPYGQGHDILVTPLDCRPCLSRVCRNPVVMECLTSIGPEEVIGAVRRRVATAAASSIS